MNWRGIWAEDALALCVLGLLGGKDVAQLAQVDKGTRVSIQRFFKRYRAGTARVGLALWIRNHVELEFQSYYQELATHQIARSNVRDPRVPPRVVSIWEERGKVPGGVVTLRPEALPKRNERGLLLRFVAAADQNPMLTSVVQTQRRIYTIVTLKIVKARGSRGGGDGDEDDAIVLRQLYYLKEYGEWRAMVPAAEKRLLDEYGALCRYDLVSHDGSVALELDVPRGADSMMDYYLVKRAAVCLPMEELLHPFVKSIRPFAKLPPASRTTERRCIVQLSFTTMHGETIASHRLASEFVVEPQETSQSGQVQGDASSDESDNQTSSQNEPRPRTGIEHFDIITIKALDEIVRTTKVEVPREPGFVWLSVIDNESTTQTTGKKPAYYNAVMLHSGAKRTRAMLTLDAQWVPGTLEAFPTPQSRQRRVLKGFLTLTSDMETHELHELKIVAQHLPAARLEPYAASIESYTRPR